MVRGKVVMRRIENATSRQVTFSKRKNGLLKKACELSVLCDVEVALVIFSQKGECFEFSSSNNIRKTMKKYRDHVMANQSCNNEIQPQNQHLKHEVTLIRRKIEQLEVSKRKLLGQSLESCALDELLKLDNKLESSLTIIRARKMHLFKEHIKNLKEKERLLMEDNARLMQHYASLCKKNSEVETEWLIGSGVSRNAQE